MIRRFREDINERLISDEKPFPCLYCSTVFRRKDNLNRHTRHHHSDNRPAPLEKKSQNERDDTQQVKLRPANVSKQKPRPKDKPKSVSALLPKSPAKISVLHVNSHKQISSRLDPRSNMIPVIRTTNELSNAVPVINGPISIKRPEEKINSPKKAFTHTEPIPLAEALVINRRIEEKLYPKSNVNQDCYFRPDYCNILDRQSLLQKVKPPRNNPCGKTMAAGRVYSPERSFSESRDKRNKIMDDLSLEDETRRREIITTMNKGQGTKEMNTPKHTVPKKRAIEELKSKPMVDDSSDFAETERANCVPTITKAGHVDNVIDLKEFNLPNHTSSPDEKISSESKVRNFGDREKSINVEKLSDTIHWRRRTSEILKPRILGSLMNPQTSKLEVSEETTDTTNDG